MRGNLRKLRRYGIAALICILGQPVLAQRVSVKTNTLYWAGATPNVGAEFRLNRHFTLNVEGLFNRVKLGSKINTRVLSVTPEARYWFSIRPQAGHFVGFMAMATDYDLTLKNKIKKGTAVGAGVTYGYSFVLSKRWSLETTAGVGLLNIRNKNYDKGTAEPKDVKSSVKFAPMKLGVSFVYIIK